MSNNDPNDGYNLGSGQISIPFPTVPAGGGGGNVIPNGGWYVFQHSFGPGTIYIDGCGGGAGASTPVEEKKINKDGCKCKKCKEMYPYADPPEPEKFICYSCRHSY